MSAHSFDGIPKLTPADVQEKHRRWLEGEPIHSEIVAIGRLVLSPGEIWTYRHDLFADFVELTGGPVARQFGEARSSLENMVRQDMVRVGLEDPVLEQTIHGGYFRQRTDVEPWHVGDPRPRQPKIMYSVVHGAAPTRGLKGDLSRDDIIWSEGDDFGHFKPGVPIGEGERLRPVDFASEDFPSGTVLRYTTLDGHASGNIANIDNGTRLATQVKVVLPEGLIVPGQQ